MTPPLERGAAASPNSYWFVSHFCLSAVFKQQLDEHEVDGSTTWVQDHLH